MMTDRAIEHAAPDPKTVSDANARTADLQTLMAISIVRLGSPRAEHEGLRIGTVRRPPRGVAKKDFARRDYYDVWLPDLSPSQRLVSFALRARDEKAWRTFERKYRAEMKKPEPSRLLDLLAALSHHTNFSVGCYCENESRCHRSILEQLLVERGAAVRAYKYFSNPASA